MSRIVFQAHVNGVDSYGLHLIELARGLKRLGYEVVVRAITVCGPGPEGITLVEGKQPEEVEILLAPLGPMATPGKRTIRMFSWESTRMPAMDIGLLNHCECAVVPSNFVASVASANGVKIPLIVVPLGVSELFTYQAMPKREVFTFACAGNVANGRERKGLHRIIELFEKAFPSEPNVRLLVKSFPVCEFNISDSRIELTQEFLREEQVAAWLARCNCFINFATGGWELWTHQAMALGRAVIGCAYGGVADYFHERVGLVVGHHLMPARDSWDGQGLWAEPEEEAAIAAMRWAFAHPNECNALGFMASQSVAQFTWENSCKQLAGVITQMSDPAVTAPAVVETVRESEELTVAITSFRRAKHLERAIHSAVAAGANHVVVATMEPGDAVKSVLANWLAKQPKKITVTALGVDLGCNELWLQAAYRSKTERLILLHDDDFLDEKLGGVYRTVIAPALDKGVGFASWRGEVVWDDGQRRKVEYWHGPTKVQSPAGLERFISTRGRLSLSPVVSVFRRTVLIRALKEAQTALTHPECLLRPGMLLGTEILAYLRHCMSFDKWLYVDQVLSYYGAHPGSGTVQAEQAGDLKPLVAGYDRARAYFKANRVQPKVGGRIIFLSNPFMPRDNAEATRFHQARITWDFHLEQGELLGFPIVDGQLTRSSADMGDLRSVPYVRDLFDYGCGFAAAEDLVVLCNMDTCLTTMAVERLRAGLVESLGIVACPRREMKPLPTGRLFRSVLNCKPDGGYDLFGVTPAWWARNRERMPDMFLGREAWDTVLRRLAEEGGGKVYVDDVCFHESHLSHWIEHRKVLLSQIHNRKLAAEFFRQRGDADMIAQLTD